MRLRYKNEIKRNFEIQMMWLAKHGYCTHEKSEELLTIFSTMTLDQLDAVFTYGHLQYNSAIFDARPKPAKAD